MRRLIPYFLSIPVLLFSIVFLNNQFVSAETQNLFDNPSAEVSQNQQPQSWAADKWGGTRATFTYAQGGAQDGSRFLTTVVTKKAGGDAKWYPAHVPVTPGQTYTFSDWYKSDVKTGIDIEYVLSNGSYRYVHIGDPGASTDWKKFQTTFVVPAKAKKLTVLHYIGRVGTLSVDNYSLVAGTSTMPPPPPPTTSAPIVVTNSETPAAQDVMVNVSNQPLGGFVVGIPTSTVTVSNLTVYIATSSTGAGLLTNVSLLGPGGVVVVGPFDATYDPVSAKQKISFLGPITLPVGTTTYTLRGKLPASFANGGTLIAYTNPAQQWTAPAQLPNVTVAMNTMTVAVSGGSLAVSTDASAPSYTVVAGGTTGVTANVIKLRASNEAINLTKVGLALTNTASSTGADLVTVTLYAGTNIKSSSGVPISTGTLLGTAVFLGNALTATSTLNTDVQISKDMDSTIIVKADIADIGTNQPGTDGHLVAINYVNSQGVGVNSGSTIYGTVGAISVAGLRTFNTFPTVALDATLPSTGVADGRLMRLKVTANSAGSLGINQLTFKVATTAAAVTDVKLFAYTDSGYSNPVPGTFGDTIGQFGSTQSAVNDANFSIVASTNPIQVPAGSTIYFELKGTVADVGSGSSVTTTLVGDSAYPSFATFMAQANALSASSFVWSPNATSTATVHSNDWTNGYGVVGLPAVGTSQTRSN
jgi:hypothetical protein